MSAEAIDTEELLARVGSGEREAAGVLIARYRDRLRRMIDLRMDARLRERLDASDIVQDACLEATRRIEDYLESPDMPFYVWLRFLTAQQLVTVLRHHLGTQARDVRREVAMRPKVPGVTTAMAADAISAHQTSPTGAAVRNEKRERIQAALDRIDEGDREVLVLRHLEGLTNVEASFELGIAPAAASKRYVRALSRLKKLLEGEGWTPGPNS